MEEVRNLGTQPLDQVLTDINLPNPELVKASTEQLTHKQVQKARKGRRVSDNIKAKICRALNASQSDKTYIEEDLFNY